MVEDEPTPVKRGRWAGHVKKVRASANGTSNLRPRLIPAPAAKPVHMSDGVAAAVACHSGGDGGAPSNGVMRTFTALFDALGAAEKGLPFKRAEEVAAAQGPGTGAGDPGFQLFGSKWLQAGPHLPRIISIRPDLFCALMGSPSAGLPLPAVPLFR